MKGRSHRTSSSEPDDWGDGSWTVDCVCGVNFDDGEEMVNCDECGVWVHTRCSRFVKGETSFACDKCKIKKRKKECEETEVAQLLVELPTKTLRMDSFPAPASFRTAAEIPIEERVHVQGIPGGDPGFFDGLSTVFSRELWKCTGYVPKKLNFQYREFPCWDDKENVDLIPFLQSKMRIDAPVVDGSRASRDCEQGSEGRNDAVAPTDCCNAREIPTVWKDKSAAHHCSESRGEERNSSPKAEAKKAEAKGASHRQQQHGSKGEKHQHHHRNHHQTKRKKEEGVGSRDYTGKKRVKSGAEKDKDEDSKKKGNLHEGMLPSRAPRSMPKNPKAMRNLAAQKFMDDDLKARNGCSNVEPHEPGFHDSVPGLTHCKLEVHDCENVGDSAQGTGLDNQDIKNEESKETSPQEIELDGISGKHAARKNTETSKQASALRIQTLEISNDGHICSVSSESRGQIDKKDCQATLKPGISSSSSEAAKVKLEASEIAGASIKQEAAGINFSTVSSFIQQDVKTAVEDASSLLEDGALSAGEYTAGLGGSLNPAIYAQRATDSDFASSKSVSGSHPQVDDVGLVSSLSMTSPPLSGAFPPELTTNLAKVKGEIKDEPTMGDVKPSLCSNYHLGREKSLGEDCKFQLNKISDPLACSQHKQPIVSGHSALKQASQLAPSGKSSRQTFYDNSLQVQKQQTLGQKQLQDHWQVVKDVEDFHGQTGQSVQSKDNVAGTDLKSGLDAPKQMLTEISQYQDDGLSEELQLTMDKSCQEGLYEQTRASPLQSPLLQQEGPLQSGHRPRVSMGSSMYTAGVIGTFHTTGSALSMQVSSSKPQSGSLRSSPGSPPLHKTAISGAGRTFTGSVSKSPTSGPVAVGNSKSSGAGIKPSMIPVSSSSATKQTHGSKQRSRASNTTDCKKDDVGSAIVRGSHTGSPGHVSPEISSSRTIVKDNVKCSTNSAAKTPSHGKSNSQAAASKQAVCNSKGYTSCSSSKALSGQNLPSGSGSADPVTTVQPQHALPTQIKQATVGTTHKNEKSSLPTSQSVLKATTTLPPTHPQVSSNISAVLSDEELALLLHQELNSSPRVPRVPRVRHTGNIPQLASSTTPSCTFVKRPTAVTPPSSSVSGQKDHNLSTTQVSRRRNREDNARESSRAPFHGIDEATKAEGLSSSPDSRRQEESNKVDEPSYLTRREAPTKSSDASYAAKKNVASTNVHSMPEGSSHSIAFESNDGHLSSVHASPGDLSDDAENTVTGGTTLTLPGLIDEILSKNQHMAYDELCDAVLPHWQNLRKHNGERYAYSSHCQAVLDCLRNRTAWAHLVDRGPKTSLGRKKRRIDAASTLDSENDEDAEGRGSIHEDERHTGRLSKLHDVDSERTDSLASDRKKNIDITHLEDVPKGKRKARRRRPLAFQGREDMDECKRFKKEDKQRYKMDGLVRTPQQDEHEPFSPLSEEAASNYSEDDNQNASRAVTMRLGSSDVSADEMESSP